MCARNLSEVADCFISKKDDKDLKLDKPELAPEQEIKRGHSLVVFGNDTIYRSFFSCNLAVEFSRQGHSVLAVDADPTLPTVDFLIGESYPRSVFDGSKNKNVPGLSYSICYDEGSELIETCSPNGGPSRLTIPLIQSIVENAGSEKLVVVNASLSLLGTDKGEARLDRVGHGWERRGSAKHGTATQARHGGIRRDVARLGMVWPGRSVQRRAGQGSAGKAQSGEAY